MGLTALAGRSWRTLSGGERQRTHIARALAQQPYGLLLDEPTNHLDVKHQLELMELLAGTGQTVLVALHDLTLAARYCDRLLLMDRGRLIAAGAPAAVLTAGHLARIFDVDAELATDSRGRPTVSYRGPLRALHPLAQPMPLPHSPPYPNKERHDAPDSHAAHARTDRRCPHRRRTGR